MNNVIKGKETVTLILNLRGKSVVDQNLSSKEVQGNILCIALHISQLLKNHRCMCTMVRLQ